MDLEQPVYLKQTNLRTPTNRLRNDLNTITTSNYAFIIIIVPINPYKRFKVIMDTTKQLVNLSIRTKSFTILRNTQKNLFNILIPRLNNQLNHPTIKH